MAVYRSDQAQFTYGTEHGQGGRPELASNTSETLLTPCFPSAISTP